MRDCKSDQERNGHIEAIVKNIHVVFAKWMNNLHQYLHVMMYMVLYIKY